SVTAAVAAKIADASFMGTLFRALRLCVGLFVLMGAVFARPQLVVEPGVAQLGAFGLILAGTIGIVFSLQATFSERRARDLAARIALAGFSLVVLFHPSTELAALAMVPIAALVGYWLVKARKGVAVEEARAV
ncbi:MAG: TRAP transporter permease, partial [Candidatus Rokubacteria bacterium]|nr:TRAP transporter permease [Candidatus Rokubacteria bacterium]